MEIEMLVPPEEFKSHMLNVFKELLLEESLSNHYFLPQLKIGSRTGFNRLGILFRPF